MKRVDVLTAQQLDISRTAAQEIIRAGHLKVDGRVIIKPGVFFPPDSRISVDKMERVFVSRGGDKLDAALNFFNLSVAGQVCMDVGASAGGFTDCLLKRGASKVYAIDNGKGQLADALRADARVVSMEETDIRNAVCEWFKEPVNFAAVDVSFISLRLVLEPVRNVLAKNADLICLIKPQFEAGRGQVSKRGIIKDEKTRRRTVKDVCAYADALGIKMIGVLPFPDTPCKDRNQEFLVQFKIKKEG